MLTKAYIPTERHKQLEMPFATTTPSFAEKRWTGNIYMRVYIENITAGRSSMTTLNNLVSSAIVQIFGYAHIDGCANFGSVRFPQVPP